MELNYEPAVQTAITEGTTRILAEIQLAKEGITHVGSTATPIRSDKLYVKGWLPGHFGATIQSLAHSLSTVRQNLTRLGRNSTEFPRYGGDRLQSDAYTGPVLPVLSDNHSAQSLRAYLGR
jgi:hypothetical protein